MPSKFQLLLASGCPVVASAPLEGELAKAVVQSGAGTVVLPEQPDRLAETLRSVYHDATLRAAWSAQGRHYATTHYDFAQAIAAYEQLFESLIDPPRQDGQAIAPFPIDPVEPVGRYREGDRLPPSNEVFL